MNVLNANGGLHTAQGSHASRKVWETLPPFLGALEITRKIFCLEKSRQESRAGNRAIPQLFFSV